MQKLIQVIKNQEKVLGLNKRNVFFVKALNRRSDFPLANDKILAKNFFESIDVPVAKTFFTLNSLFEISKIYEDLKKLPGFVIKPANGSQGNGILVIKGFENDQYVTVSGRTISPKGMQYELSSILFGKYSLGRPDSVLIEERLIPDEEICFGVNLGLPDIRLIFIKEKLKASMLRLPTQESKGKANLHQGGIGVGIDLDTGTTSHAYYKGRYISYHPESGCSLIDHQIPMWKELVSFAEEIAKKSPLKFIGLDATLDRNRGPVFIEMNARPGLEIQNVNYRGIMDE
ncbi:MAG: hypothetical protein D6797_06775 [Bdellovibrio sp.]|nr:MAG: hypothetical protein D6797_06775 [Bdellovibrio sp.]